jgi:hypothetical protein
LHHEKEVRDRYVTSEDEPDIVVFDAGEGANIDLDISLAHPWSSEILSRSSKEDRAAAQRQEDNKVKKYSQLNLPGGDHPNFIPLVFEHFGKWGREAEEYLRVLAKRSKALDNKSNYVEFLTFWRRRFSVILQKTNAGVILKKICRLC